MREEMEEMKESSARQRVLAAALRTQSERSWKKQFPFLGGLIINSPRLCSDKTPDSRKTQSGQSSKIDFKLDF